MTEQFNNTQDNGENNGELKVKPNRIADHIAKVLAVVVALFIWFYAVGTDTRLEEKTFSSNEIEITGVSSELSVLYGSGEMADVTVSGRYADINALKKGDISVYVDASGLTQAGQYSLPVNVRLENGITLSSVYPEKITVYISVNQKNQIPIKVTATDYQIPSGSTISTEIKGKGYISVEGPVDVLERISHAGVTVSPGVISDSVTIVAPVVLYDTDGKEFSSPYVTVDKSEVTVYITVLKEKEIPLEISSKNGYYNSNNTTVTVTPSKITVRGEASAVDAITSIVVSTVDETQITDDTVINAKIVLPDGVENLSGYENVTVDIKHTGTVTKKFAVGTEKMFVINAPENKMYEIGESVVNVLVRMDKNSSYSAYMTSDDIAVTLDLSEYGDVTGRHNVPLSIVLRTPSNPASPVYVIGNYSIPVVFS